MAYEIPGFKLGTLETPSTVFAARQYYAVTASSSHPYIAAPSDGEAMIGILQNAPAVAGESAEIMTEGVSKAYTISALNEGDNFIVGPNGAIASTSNAAAKYKIYGPVLLAATSGTYTSVLLKTVGITT